MHNTLALGASMIWTCLYAKLLTSPWHSLNLSKEVGNGVLTTAEERTHFGLWAIMKSPLLLGTDLTKIASSSLNIIKNEVSNFPRARHN